MAFKPTPWRERFPQKVDRSAGQDACWLWLGGRAPNGYGRFNLEHAKPVGAHRAAWMFEHGDIPDGMSVLHRCDNRPCVNPAHLYVGTQRDNLRDMVARGRYRGNIAAELARLGKGHTSWRATLTPAQVIAMRERYATTGVTASALGAEFGVGETATYHITSGRVYRWVGGPLTRRMPREARP